MSFATAFALAVALTASADVPSNQELVFYNARIALRERRASDALRLWLMRNALVQRREPTAVDADFRSVVWASLGSLGLCQDGFPSDEGGAGLWPLAFHNYLALSASRQSTDVPNPWEVFTVGRQQRFVTLHDVLDAQELRSVTFHRGFCLAPRMEMAEHGELPWKELDDRLLIAQLLKKYLERSLTTLDRAKVRNTAAIEARLFDLDIALAELVARRAREEANERAADARELGVSRAGAQELKAQLQQWPEGSPQTQFLRKVLGWTPEEWLSLSQARRLSLFARAKTAAKDPKAVQALELSMIDALIDRRDGQELSGWIGWLDGKDPQTRALVTDGERGRRLLELDLDTGFTERAVVSLHRGVSFLQAGALEEALRSFAYAMAHAEESREADATLALSRRWLSYVLSRFETTSELVATLQALVPKQEYNAVVDELLWRAALRADARSFERLAASVKHGGALDLELSRLRPLANGNPGAMATDLRNSVVDEPYSVMRFLQTLLERIEGEDAQVRNANAQTLRLVGKIVDPLFAEGKATAHKRRAEELRGRAQSILDGLEELEEQRPGDAHTLSPNYQTFAGAIRLAPSDALPWPFSAPSVNAPSVFVPLELLPIEWLDGNGARVFGWKITE